MFNVLPDIFKKDILVDYNKRLILTWFLVIIVLQISFLALMFSSYMNLKFQEKNLSAENKGAIKDLSKQDIEDTAKMFSDVNNQLDALASSVTSRNTSEFINKLVSVKGVSISFNEIIYNKVNATTSKISLKGVALNRESLLSLQKRLERDNLFGNVDLPVSNFAKNSNIDFSLSMIVQI